MATRARLVVVAAGFAAMLLAARAPAQEGLLWIAGDAPGAPTLIYGLPDSDFVVLSFGCTRSEAGVAIAYDFEPPGTKAGARHPLDLSSAGGSLRLDATARFLEMLGGHILVATAELGGLFTAILTTGPTLTLTVAAETRDLPLPPPTMAGAFLLACTALRSEPPRPLAVAGVGGGAGWG